MPTAPITPCLWFNHDAEEAARFYTSLLPDSAITRSQKSPADSPSGPAGIVIVVEFTLGGRPFMGLNGGAAFRFTEAVSLMITCADQAEVDRLWRAFLDNGGEASACGWLKDRWGMSWQITPRRLLELMADPDPGRARRTMESMMTMSRIDIAELERAADGD